MQTGPSLQRRSPSAGFTILELIVIVFIISILAALALTTESKVMEKGRAVEAKSTLGLIRKAQETYRIEHGDYAEGLPLLSIEVPTECTSTHYFKYSVTNTTATAERCTVGGKRPDSGAGYDIGIRYDSGEWEGSSSYY